MNDGASCHYQDSVRVGVRVSVCVLGRVERGEFYLFLAVKFLYVKHQLYLTPKKKKVFPEYEADLKNQCSSLIGF